MARGWHPGIVPPYIRVDPPRLKPGALPPPTIAGRSSVPGALR